MDWLLLILFVPLVIVPAVLLWGFAGCGLDVVGTGPVTMPPTNLIATALSSSSIKLEWTDNMPGQVTYTVRRGKSNTGLSDIPLAMVKGPGGQISGTDSTGLDPDTTYFYQVWATFQNKVLNGGESSIANATTLATVGPPGPIVPGAVWKVAYAIPPIPLTEDEGDYANYTIVQRIDAPLLDDAATGTKIRVTLRAAAALSTEFTAVTISEPALVGQAYDSAPAPAPLVDLLFKDAAGVIKPGVTIVPGGSAVSEPALYSLDPTKDLLIAADLGASGGGRRATNVLNAQFFFKKNDTQAKNRNRPGGYNNRDDFVYFVEKIEVM